MGWVTSFRLLQNEYVSSGTSTPTATPSAATGTSTDRSVCGFCTKIKISAAVTDT